MTFNERKSAFQFAVERKGKWRSKQTDRVVEIVGIEGADSESAIMWTSFRLKHESGRISKKAAHYFVEEYSPA